MHAFATPSEHAVPTDGTTVPGEDRVYRYLKWLPALWLTGLHVIVPMFLAFRLALSRWPTDATTNVLAGCWALVSLSQGMAVVYNWSLTNEGTGYLVGRLASSTTLGWGIIGIALAAGSSWSLAAPRMVRGVMVLGLHVAVIGPLVLALGLAAGIESVRLPTPTSILLGHSDAVEFYAVASVFQKEESSFGLPRLVLFFPWSTALSLAGICILLICACERDARWRAAGIAGGLVAVAFSFSRAGYAVLPVCLAVLAVLRARPAPLLAGLVVACAAALAFVLLDVNPAKLLDSMVTTMRESRAGSSQARDTIYEASWQGFLDSPWLGWGWVGGSVISQEEIRVGSHSSVYGTLYTGGAVTFASLVLAALATSFALLRRALVSRDTAPAVAVAVMTALVMFSYGEALYSLVPPLLFVFMFLGGALSPTDGASGKP